MFTVRLLADPDRAPVASLLADAFEVDSGYRALFPGPERPAGLRDLFERNLGVHLPYKATFVGLDDAGEPVATATVRPPGGVPIGALTMLRHGALPFALAHGAAALRRLLWLKRTYDALGERAAGGRPHWLLHMMAVAPRAQGQGLGTRMLDEVLRTRVATAPDVPVVLTTHLEVNVVFYRRAGFEVLEESTLTMPGSAPYAVWVMRREPVPGRAATGPDR